MHDDQEQEPARSWRALRVQLALLAEKRRWRQWQLRPDGRRLLHEQWRWVARRGPGEEPDVSPEEAEEWNEANAAALRQWVADYSPTARPDDIGEEEDDDQDD